MKKFRRIMATVFSSTAVLGFIGIIGIDIDHPGWGWWLLGAAAVAFGSMLLIFVCEEPHRAAEMIKDVFFTTIYIFYLAISWFGHSIWRLFRRIGRACKAFTLDPERTVTYTYKNSKHSRG